MELYNQSFFVTGRAGKAYRYLFSRKEKKCMCK